MVYDVFVSDEFTFKAEVDERNHLILHMDVFEWSPAILKRMRLIAEEGMEEFKNQGFTKAYCVTDNPKLVQMVYAGELRKTVDIDNKEYEVIVWDFQQQ
jgi:hypothetical protein